MKQVGIVGWRGMVGSVLLQRMIEENDFEILRTILKKVKHPVIAEGNVNSPEKAKRVIELGSYAVVVGSSITRPQLITKGYAEAVNSVEKETTV